MNMTRRQMILRAAATTFGLGLAGCSSLSPGRPKKVLFFSKSSGFEHSVIQRKNGQPSFAENILADFGPRHGIDFTFSKDGSLFTPAYLAQFDAYYFHTTGDLTAEGTDKNPPMTPAGKDAFLDAVKNGKGFIGSHCAADTFHTHEPEGTDQKNRAPRYENYGANADPYIRMIGGEFIIHGEQQESRMRVTEPRFPGLKNAGDGFVLKEEWYSLKDFSDNLHVILVQQTDGMKGRMYARPPYPATWARMHGQGRVFYTSMGHREEVWLSTLFQEILFGGIAWAVRNVDANVTPNLDQAAPGCLLLPPK
jgi:type 1 glutamine amidotransferase